MNDNELYPLVYTACGFDAADALTWAFGATGFDSGDDLDEGDADAEIEIEVWAENVVIRAPESGELSFARRNHYEEDEEDEMTDPDDSDDEEFDEYEQFSESEGGVVVDAQNSRGAIINIYYFENGTDCEVENENETEWDDEDDDDEDDDEDEDD